MALVWLYTFRGGVKSLIWTDSLKTFCLVVSVVLCIYYIASDLNLSFTGMVNTVVDSDFLVSFFFDDVNDKRYFFKQFPGRRLHHDCYDRGSIKIWCNEIWVARTSKIRRRIWLLVEFRNSSLFYSSSCWVFFCIHLQRRTELQTQQKWWIVPYGCHGRVFPCNCWSPFIVGLISSAYSAAGSALTALTTSFTVDILGTKGKSEQEIVTIRKQVHIGMAIVMGIVIFIFNILNNTSVIDAVYILASYTYGPILGLFAFGMLTKNKCATNTFHL